MKNDRESVGPVTLLQQRRIDELTERRAQSSAQSAALPRPRREKPADEPLVDVDYLRDLARFTRNAIARHARIVVLITVGFGLLGGVAAVLLPGKYYSEAKVLADRNVVMPLLGNPGRRLPNEADTPTHLAAEFITNFDNLATIVDSLKLVEEANGGAWPLGSLRQQVRRALGRAETPDEQRQQAVKLLRSRMTVNVTEGTLTIGVNWPDPQVARDIVTVAQQQFIASRQAQELALIKGSIDILTEASQGLSVDIRRSLDSLSRQRRALTPADVQPMGIGPRVTRIDPELMVARQSLEESTRALSELQQSRARQVQELQTKLAEQRMTYGAAHPEFRNTEQLLRTVLVEPPQVVELRSAVDRYRKQIEDLGGNAIINGNNDQVLAAAAIRSIEGMRTDSVVQEKQAYGRTRLRIALESYNEMLQRLDAAKMELKTVGATFKYKYGVLIPATVPRHPVSRVPLLVLGAVILGLLMGMFAALALDIGQGRVLEAWQIERSLGMPVLGEADLPRLKA